MGKRALAYAGGDQSWEGKSNYWRWFLLAELGATIALCLFAFFIWLTKNTYFHVEEPLIPGRYPVGHLSDAEFSRVAGQFVNLIGTYRWVTAKDQFQTASEFLVEPMASQFKAQYLGKELQAINDTRRTQTMYIDEYFVAIDRPTEDTVVVELSGSGEKLIGESWFDVASTYVVTMQVVDDETANEYGIVITDFQEYTA